MNKTIKIMIPKILIIVLITIVAIAAVVLVTHRQKQPKEGIAKQQLLQKFQTLKTQYEQAKAQGYDVSEVERLEKETRQIYDNGDYKKVNKVLDSAFKILEKIKISEPSSTTPPTPTSTIPSANPCETAPAQYKSQCEKGNTWLDKKLVEWKPKEYAPMKFNGHLIFASENLIDRSIPDVDSKFFNVINDLDTDTISLFIFPDMFEKHKQRYENLINKIRASNKELYVSYMVGVVSDGFHRFKDFKEYKDTELNFTKMFVEKYHPDYYVVVDEITTMERRTGLNISDSEWKGLVTKVADLVKKSSPETKTVATGHSGELNFLKGLTDINNLDLIGLNIWGVQQIDETTAIGKEIKNTINYVKQNGKGIIFEQTWSLLHDAPEAKKASKQEFMKNLDAKYVKVMAYYANLNNVSIYNPFYTGQFVYYGENPTEFKSALDGGQRMPVFYAYKSLIEEFRNNTKK